MTTVIQFPERAATLTAQVSEEVRALLGRYDVSQTELGEWLGITQPAVSARLRGLTEWKVREIELIAEAFAIHPAALMGGFATTPMPPDGPGTVLPIVSARAVTPKYRVPREVLPAVAA